jgi:small nuclear ribonucleoprotein (snRNP)-like protein
MSGEPSDQGLTDETAAANEEVGSKESWLSHPAAAVVKATVGRSVLMVLNDGRELKGTCTCFDWLGNFVLSDWTQNIHVSASGSLHVLHFAERNCKQLIWPAGSRFFRNWRRPSNEWSR